jgi:hypothetical protein
MKITMLVSFNGVFDGDRVGPFVGGQHYDVDLSLADRFIRSSMAVEYVEPILAEEDPE